MDMAIRDDTDLIIATALRLSISRVTEEEWEDALSSVLPDNTKTVLTFIVPNQFIYAMEELAETANVDPDNLIRHVSANLVWMGLHEYARIDKDVEKKVFEYIARKKGGEKDDLQEGIS